ncbi:MAG: ABC transporter substrate-binding protein [Nitratireductor sp.]|nr:ABC transporter substrate-binding protein [Nitratireductor sp.]
MAIGTFGHLANASAADLVVGYFPEWPMPFQFAQAGDQYQKAGLNIKWVSFDAGTAMSAAMASGDVNISISQGVTPFLTAVSAGQDLIAVSAATSYTDNNNCVVRASLEITKANAKELEGKVVAVPLATAAHTDFLAQMEHFGIDVSTMKVVDMAPVDGAAAFANGNLDMVCGWGGPLLRMKEFGNVLVEGAEKEAISGKLYDVISSPRSWASENAETLSKFLAVTEAMNDKYNSGGADEMLPVMAKQAGMEVESARATISVMRFNTAEEQLGPDWMGGFMQKNFLEAAKKMEEGGTIKALDSYDNVVDSSYLRAATKM